MPSKKGSGIFGDIMSGISDVANTVGHVASVAIPIAQQVMPLLSGASMHLNRIHHKLGLPQHNNEQMIEILSHAPPAYLLNLCAHIHNIETHLKIPHHMRGVDHGSGIVATAMHSLYGPEIDDAGASDEIAGSEMVAGSYAKRRKRKSADVAGSYQIAGNANSAPVQRLIRLSDLITK